MTIARRRRGSAVPGVILIVDPDPAAGRMVQLVLEREGHATVTVASTEDAVAWTEREPPAAILWDARTPDPGRSTEGPPWAALAELAPEAAVVVMTVDPAPEAEVAALDAGADGVLVKPFGNLRLVQRRIARAVQAAADRAARQRLDRAVDDAQAGRDALESELRDAEARLAALDPETLSGVDESTGLPTTAATERRLREEAARALRYGRPLALVVCRVDGLEAIGLRYGEETAHEAFRGFAALARAAVREVDVVGRSGPQDLLLILPETNRAAGLRAAERVRAVLGTTSILAEVAAGGRPVPVTACFGVAALPDDTMNADALLQRARDGLARARREGPNRVAFGVGA